MGQNFFKYIIIIICNVSYVFCKYIIFKLILCNNIYRNCEDLNHSHILDASIPYFYFSSMDPN